MRYTSLHVSQCPGGFGFFYLMKVTLGRYMEKWLHTYNSVFTTKRLGLTACFLAGYLLMKGFCIYYDFHLVAALAAAR